MIRKALVSALLLVGVIAFAPHAEAQYQPGQPGIILTPSTVTAGALATAAGFGCAKASTVEVRIDGTVVGTGKASNDVSGSFSIPFTAPTTPGQYAVVASCLTTEVSSILSVVALPTTTVIVASLPITGGESGGLVKVALLLVAVGGLLVLAVRRRREV